MNQVYVKTKNQRLFFEIPKTWTLLTFAEFSDNPPRKDLKTAALNALKHPISSRPLTDRVSVEDAIAIIVEDLTRASPKKEILKTLLKQLKAVSIPDEQIVIVMALGTHRALSTDELSDAFGEDLIARYTFMNHDCHSPDLVPIGTLRTGTQVRINAKVHAADFRIGIGSVFPHPLNGFGGGGKILFPGVADFDSILEHHLKYAFRDGSGLGKTDGNPFYEEIKTIARLAHLDFVINSVLDHNDRLFEIVSGDPIDAHRHGIKICKGIISKEFEKEADITVISSFPYTEGNQIMKPLAPASLITRPGGFIILVADCTVPLTEAYLNGCEKFRAKHKDNLQEAVFDLFDNNRRILPDEEPEFNMSMAQALLAQNDYRVILVTRDIEPDQVWKIGFQYASDLPSAFEKANQYYTEPEVHVVPSGGVILPVIHQ
jgi:nickel-dependent lactate racemase